MSVPNECHMEKFHHSSCVQSQKSTSLLLRLLRVVVILASGFDVPSTDVISRVTKGKCALTHKNSNALAQGSSTWCLWAPGCPQGQCSRSSSQFPKGW